MQTRLRVLYASTMLAVSKTRRRQCGCVRVLNAIHHWPAFGARPSVVLHLPTFSSPRATESDRSLRQGQDAWRSLATCLPTPFLGIKNEKATTDGLPLLPTAVRQRSQMAGLSTPPQSCGQAVDLMTRAMAKPRLGHGKVAWLQGHGNLPAHVACRQCWGMWWRSG